MFFLEHKTVQIHLKLEMKSSSENKKDESIFYKRKKNPLSLMKQKDDDYDEDFAKILFVTF